MVRGPGAGSGATFSPFIYFPGIVPLCRFSCHGRSDLPTSGACVLFPMRQALLHVLGDMESREARKRSSVEGTSCLTPKRRSPFTGCIPSMTGVRRGSRLSEFLHINFIFHEPQVAATQWLAMFLLVFSATALHLEMAAVVRPSLPPPNATFPS
ncbi:unnamed protein product, partial [Pylaiella littoralis]